MLHASLAALWTGGGWRGALLLGPSGAGKSDLLLRLVDVGWRLVADDRVVVWASGGRAFGSAPAPLRGLIELRGQGMARAAALPFAPVAFVAELGETLERQPERRTTRVAGVPAPVHAVRPGDASAPARLRRLFPPVGLAHPQA